MSLNIFLSFLLLSFTFANDVDAVKEKETVTIIVLEGKAYLAHVDESGKVIHKYMEIEGEVDTKTNLDGQVEKAKSDYLELKEREKDQIRFIAYDFLSEKVEPMAMTHLSDLADHYNNSYANQIIITFGKRPGNEAYLKEKENLVVSALINLKIPEEDIEVRYKWDRGPEPTEFIKVNTTLRDLPNI